MFKITIYEKDYDINNIFAKVKAQLDKVLASDVKILEFKRNQAIVQTACNAYTIALKELLP